MSNESEYDNNEDLPNSNEVLNIILIALGTLFFVEGISQFLVWFGVNPPNWLQEIFNTTSGSEGQAAMALIGQSGMIRLMLGIWTLISGIGMFKEQEWAWGQAIVVLTIVFFNSLTPTINFFSGTIDPNNISSWITLLGFFTSVLGFFWLLVTKKRYS